MTPNVRITGTGRQEVGPARLVRYIRRFVLLLRLSLHPGIDRDLDRVSSIKVISPKQCSERVLQARERHPVRDERGQRVSVALHQRAAAGEVLPPAAEWGDQRDVLRHEMLVWVDRHFSGVDEMPDLTEGSALAEITDSLGD